MAAVSAEPTIYNPTYQHQKFLISGSDFVKRLLLVNLSHIKHHTGRTGLQNKALQPAHQNYCKMETQPICFVVSFHTFSKEIKILKKNLFVTGTSRAGRRHGFTRTPRTTWSPGTQRSLYSGSFGKTVCIHRSSVVLNL